MASSAHTGPRKISSARADSSAARAGDQLELLARGATVGTAGAHPRCDLVLEPGDAHLEELVEVLAEDGEELHPLEHRRSGLLGQSQHPCVEVEPGELAVQIALSRIIQSWVGGRWHASTLGSRHANGIRGHAEHSWSYRFDHLGAVTPVDQADAGAEAEAGSSSPVSQMTSMRSPSPSRLTRSRLRRNCGSCGGRSIRRAMHAGAERVDHLRVAEIGGDLPVRRRGTGVGDPGVGDGRELFLALRVDCGVLGHPPRLDDSVHDP